MVCSSGVGLRVGCFGLKDSKVDGFGGFRV